MLNDPTPITPPYKYASEHFEKFRKTHKNLKQTDEEREADLLEYYIKLIGQRRTNKLLWSHKLLYEYQTEYNVLVSEDTLRQMYNHARVVLVKSNERTAYYNTFHSAGDYLGKPLARNPTS